MRNVLMTLVVISLFSLGFPAQGTAQAVLNTDCYPTNGYVINPGPTYASGVGEGRFTASKLENNPAGKNTQLGPGSLHVEFAAEIVGANTAGKDGMSNGTMNGSAFVVMRWDDPSRPAMVFEAGCPAEVQTDTAGTAATQNGEFEGEYEGAVTNFPGFEGATKTAVASIVAARDDNFPNRYQVQFSIELGYTCYEDNNGQGDVEIDKITLGNQSSRNFKIKNVLAGRWSFPPGFNDSNNRCSSSYTD